MRRIYSSASLLTIMLVAAGCDATRTTGPGGSPPAARTTPAASSSGTSTSGDDPAAESPAGGPLVVTDASFRQQVLENSQPVMVDVWAAWCGPCRQLAPTVVALAEQYQGRAVVAKLDLDENPEIPAEYGVQGIPTLLFFKDGKLAKKLVGLRSKAEIARVLDSLLES